MLLQMAWFVHEPIVFHWLYLYPFIYWWTLWCSHSWQLSIVLQWGFLVVQGLRLWAPDAGGPDVIPSQGARSHMLQCRLRVPCAITKVWGSQINTSFLTTVPQRTGVRVSLPVVLLLDTGLGMGLLHHLAALVLELFKDFFFNVDHR